MSTLYIVETIPRHGRDPLTGIKWVDLNCWDQTLLTRSGVYARLIALEERLVLFPFRKVRVRKV